MFITKKSVLIVRLGKIGGEMIVCDLTDKCLFLLGFRIVSIICSVTFITLFLH